MGLKIDGDDNDVYYDAALLEVSSVIELVVWECQYGNVCDV